MALHTTNQTHPTQSGAPSGDYVPASVAQELEQTLSKLTWHVLYGKSHDASGLAVTAEQLLQQLRARK